MTRLRVHRNLHTQRWTLTERRRKVGERAALVLVDVRFVVSEAGRQRVLAHRQRAVHAWADGELAADRPVPATARRGTYNPYRAATFTDADTGAPLLTATTLWFTPAGMFYQA